MSFNNDSDDCESARVRERGWKHIERRAENDENLVPLFNDNFYKNNVEKLQSTKVLVKQMLKSYIQQRFSKNHRQDFALICKNVTVFTSKTIFYKPIGICSDCMLESPTKLNLGNFMHWYKPHFLRKWSTKFPNWLSSLDSFNFHICLYIIQFNHHSLLTLLKLPIFSTSPCGDDFTCHYCYLSDFVLLPKFQQTLIGWTYWMKSLSVCLSWMIENLT